VKIKYEIRFYLLTYHVIKRMGNDDFTHKYGDFGTLDIFGTAKHRHFIK